MNSSTEIILSILIMAAIVVATYFLIKFVIKDIRKNREEKNLLIDGIISKSEMNSIIAMYMNRMGENANFSVLYVDLDKFGDFVLAFGYSETNQILKNIAQRIKKIMPKNSYVSKYKDDEFLIFFPQLYDRSEVLVYANELLETFRRPLSITGDKDIDLTASIAVAYYPLHGRSIKDLLDSLNLAIYRIKKEGGNNLRIYSQDLTDEEENIEYYYQIKQAIRDKEFEFHYQPIYNIDSNTIFGFEALLRWHHPQHGTISPYKFLNLLDQSGDIHWVGVWGFEEIVKKHLELRFQSGIHLPKLSLNLSPKQVYNSNIVPQLSKILKRYKVMANNFVLEIGEFALFESQETIIENIQQLKKLGFQIAIDGFGLDIGTLERLSSLNIRTIKVNYDFIQEDTFIVKKHLEILQQYTENEGYIVVQGIEDEKQLNRVKGFGIKLAQGFYYSKPVSSEEMLKLNEQNIDKISQI